MDQQKNHLNTLAVFHYIFAGVSAITACFPIFHLILGLSMIFGDFYPEDIGAGMPFSFDIFGFMFTVIPAIIILVGWVFAIAVAVSGYFLSQRRNYLYCLIVAGISCLFTPFGTIIGVLTILELLKEDVKASFNGQQ